MLPQIKRKAAQCENIFYANSQLKVLMTLWHLRAVTFPPPPNPPPMNKIVFHSFSLLYNIIEKSFEYIFSLTEDCLTVEATPLRKLELKIRSSSSFFIKHSWVCKNPKYVNKVDKLFLDIYSTLTRFPQRKTVESFQNFAP